jgi:hypothetical protein
MPLSLADFARAEVELEVKTSVGPLAVRYRPNAMTPQLEAEITRTANEAATDTLLRMFCAVVAWMDVEGPLEDAHGVEVLGPGEQMPMQPEYIGMLPSRLLTQVFTAVQEDMSGGPKRGSGSSDGSFTNGSKGAARRSGTD